MAAKVDDVRIHVHIRLGLTSWLHLIGLALILVGGISLTAYLIKLVG